MGITTIPTMWSAKAVIDSIFSLLRLAVYTTFKRHLTLLGAPDSDATHVKCHAICEAGRLQPAGWRFASRMSTISRRSPAKSDCMRSHGRYSAHSSVAQPAPVSNNALGGCCTTEVIWWILHAIWNIVVILYIKWGGDKKQDCPHPKKWGDISPRPPRDLRTWQGVSTICLYSKI